MNSPSLLTDLGERSPALLLRTDKGDRLSLLVKWLSEWGERRRDLTEEGVEGARATASEGGAPGLVFSATGLDLLPLACLRTLIHQTYIVPSSPSIFTILPSDPFDATTVLGLCAVIGKLAIPRSKYRSPAVVTFEKLR